MMGGNEGTKRTGRGRYAVVVDRNWAAERRTALGFGTAFAGLLALLDWASGGLDPLRLGCWSALGAAVVAVLLPDRVTAGATWMATRNGLGERRVCTETLTSVRRSAGRTDTLVLSDALGGRITVDIPVIVANPQLWHRLDTGIRHSERLGTLVPARTDDTLLLTIAEQVDHETVRRIFTASDLD